MMPELCPKHGDPRDTSVAYPEKAPCMCRIENMKVRQAEDKERESNYD